MCSTRRLIQDESQAAKIALNTQMMFEKRICFGANNYMREQRYCMLCPLFRLHTSLLLCLEEISCSVNLPGLKLDGRTVRSGQGGFAG